ncbi:MAG: leucine-rich repeat domain-containing protein [Prevotella sp.]|nr:leucine-rich repeat domain-containing protein [Prevotella sp.]
MEALNENPHKIYIKSNTVTVMRFLFFLSGILLVLVAGLCIFVVFGRDDTNNYHWYADGQFYYTLDDGAVTIVKSVDPDATQCVIPASVNYGGKNYPVTTIGVNAFTNHRTLTAVTLPDSVTKIAGDAKKQKGAFSGCTALNTVQLGQGVAHIEAYAFKNCVALQSIQFPASVQFVQNGAFQGCLALETIELNGNGILGDKCFADCLNVTTLKLADDVRLTDDTRRVLADLTALTDFVVTAANSTYQVQGGCLLTKTTTDNDTLVLGGRGANVPTGVTQIMDWAWGKRAADKMYVPSTVTAVGANSFNNELIFTNVLSKPVGWLTTVPVYTNAYLVTFVAEGNKTATAYVYRNPQGEFVEPDYNDLFADVDSATPFLEWSEILPGIECKAIYQSTDKADTDSIDALKEALTDAEVYLYDADVRLRLTFDCWENFKMLYDHAAMVDTETAYQYVVDDAVQKLQTATKQIDSALSGTGDQQILESTNWYVGLQNLISDIYQLDLSDLAESTDDHLIDDISELVSSAEFLVAHYLNIDNETGNLVLRNLRDKFESLEVDVEGQLRTAITACEALNRSNYTADSWQNLQDCLAYARQITAHNLSISSVRRALENARADLREVTLTDNLIRINTWVSICQDLDIKDYQASEYDQLFVNLHLIIANADDLVTNAKINSTLSALQNDYQSLVVIDNTAVYNNSTGILNKNSLPYFITAVILFTGAVMAGAAAGTMKHQLRQSQE